MTKIILPFFLVTFVAACASPDVVRPKPNPFYQQ